MTENQLFLAIAALRLEAARTKSQELREACDAAADCLWLKREVLWRHRYADHCSLRVFNELEGDGCDPERRVGRAARVDQSPMRRALE